MSYWSDHIVTELQREYERIPVAQAEVTQHLAELGYLQTGTLNTVNTQQIKHAITRFFAEAMQSQLFNLTILAQQGLTNPDELAPFLLRKCTNIDDGLHISRFPKNNELCLISRIIHYRLELIGSWEHRVDLPFTPLNTLHALEQLATHTKTTALEALNLLGNMDAFAAHLMNTYASDHFIVCFQCEKIDPETAKEIERPLAFKRQLIDDFGERTEYFKFLKQNIFTKKPDTAAFNYLHSLNKKPFNRLIIRLVQLFQWRNGFYNGLLDGNAGPLTVQSLLPAFDMLAEQNKTSIKPHRLITIIDKGYILMNCHYYFTHLLQTDEGELAIDEGISQLMETYHMAEADKQEVFNVNFEKLRTDTWNQTKHPKERRGLIERSYYGITTFFKRILNFSQRLFRWICHRFDRFKNFLTSWLSAITEDIRKGIKAFLTGITFLFGNNSIIHHRADSLVASVVKPFGDSFTLAIGDFKPLVEDQCQQIKYKTAAVDFSLAVTGGIIKLAVNAINFMGWPMLLLSIAKVFRNISNSYKNLELTTLIV